MHRWRNNSEDQPPERENQPVVDLLDEFETSAIVGVLPQSQTMRSPEVRKQRKPIGH
jgi:hypothetical protein